MSATIVPFSEVPLKHLALLATLIALTSVAFGTLTTAPQAAEAAALCTIPTTAPTNQVNDVAGTPTAPRVNFDLAFRANVRCNSGILAMSWEDGSSVTFNSNPGIHPIRRGETIIVLQAGDRPGLFMRGQVEGRAVCNTFGKCNLTLQVRARADGTVISYELTANYDRQSNSGRVIDCAGYAYLGSNLFP